MTFNTIALSESMKDYIDLKVSSGKCSTAGEFLAALIEREKEHEAKQKVNSLLRTTLLKNKTVEATNEWWKQQRQHLNEQLPSQTRIVIYEYATPDLQGHFN
jgi:Arc/MetJ-type ribon-helix-helix transcriptional regulator